MRIILGVDPGTIKFGYSILRNENNKTFVLDYGLVKLTAKKTLICRVGKFYDFLLEKIKEYKITELAIETPFLGKNVETYGKLSYLRGILYLLSYQSNIELKEFRPLDVKKGISGYNNSTKEQVANLVYHFFPKLPKDLKDDVTDSFAVSLCALWQNEKLKFK